jgi:hypothetical protein
MEAQGASCRGEMAVQRCQGDSSMEAQGASCRGEMAVPRISIDEVSQMSRRANSSLQSLFRGNWSGAEADSTSSLDRSRKKLLLEPTSNRKPRRSLESGSRAKSKRNSLITQEETLAILVSQELDKFDY